MSNAHLPFKEAVEAKDPLALGACFAVDSVFNSPASYGPFEGRETVLALLKIVMDMFEDFIYTDVFDGGDTAALFFEARVGDRKVQGVDYLTFGSDGLIDSMTVMIRPLSGLNAVSEYVGQRLTGQ